MDVEQTETELTERRVVRRGLLGGVAALGAAALLHLKHAEIAQANGETMIVAANNPPVVDATAVTILHANVPGSSALFVQNGGGSSGNLAATGIHASAGAVFGVGVRAIGGGLGVYAGTGANSFNFPQTAGVAGADDGYIPPSNNFVWKRGLYGSASNLGVHGRTAAGYGVLGEGTAGGTGVRGQSNAGASATTEGTGTGIGVHGKSGSGSGVQGESNSGFGVYGATAASAVGVVGLSSSGVGVWGQSTGHIGVVGFSTGLIAIHGNSTGPGVGVYGESTSGIGVTAISKVANTAALHAETTVVGPGALAARFIGDVIIHGSYTAFGTKSAVVPHPDGAMRTLYCTEATEAYFEDFGRGQLVGGVALVRLDPEFAPLVHRNAYDVFLTPHGDSRGLYVQMDANGFEVREQQGGKSNISFSYRIVAKRVDVPSERLKRVDPNAIKGLGNKATIGLTNIPRPAAPLEKDANGHLIPPNGPAQPGSPASPQGGPGGQR